MRAKLAKWWAGLDEDSKVRIKEIGFMIALCAVAFGLGRCSVG